VGFSRRSAEFKRGIGVKILIAEDDPTTRQLLKSILVKWGYDVIDTSNGNEAWQALQAEEAPRLAILDWKMPGMDGTEICRKVRQEVNEHYIYIILLTARDRDEDLIAGMEAGADDYITKPFKTSELRVRLRAGRRIVELQNELIAAREILKRQAAYDSLTGLLNHGEILRILKNELAKADREGNSVGLIMADIDSFKKINDTYGHMAGDVVLRLTSERMHSLMRSYDFVGRYGGEEFMIILPGFDLQGAVALAERLRQSINDEGMNTPEGMIPVTISLGVTLSDMERKLDMEALIKAADSALYKAKKNGRNRVEVV
jgi:diguanylate cyclase (GGDEF)-like protein